MCLKKDESIIGVVSAVGWEQEDEDCEDEEGARRVFSSDHLLTFLRHQIASSSLYRSLSLTLAAPQAEPGGGKLDMGYGAGGGQLQENQSDRPFLPARRHRREGL